MLTAKFLNLDKLEARLTRLPQRVQAGVKVIGVAATYALIWEYGRVKVKPGPKTLYSTNPFGELRVLTITAPHGWIRINRDRFNRVLKEEIRKARLSQLPLDEFEGALTEAIERAATECMEIMRDSAPHDTGLLIESLQLVKGNDAMLQESMDVDLVA